MELILPAVISVLTEIIKRLAARFGHELTSAVVKIIVLIGCIAAAVAIQKQIISYDTIREIGQMLALAVAYYEIGYKWILKPVFDRVI